MTVVMPKNLDAPLAIAPPIAVSRQYQIDVLVPGRADGLVIKRVHFADLGEAQDYQERLAGQNLYVADVSFCKDESCKDFDITRD